MIPLGEVDKSSLIDFASIDRFEAIIGELSVVLKMLFSVMSAGEARDP